MSGRRSETEGRVGVRNEMDASTLLSIRGLDVRYGPVSALRAVDLDVGAEDLTVVIGPNGAGKTTLLRAICGVVPARSGSITLSGEPVGRHGPEKMLALGVTMVPEGRHVFPHLSVEDNLVLGAFRFRRARARVRSNAQGVYDLFPVLADRRGQAAGTLSGGEQQMLAIGRALMSEPRLLCLDEPSLGLAPRVVSELFSLLGELRQRGVAVLLVEQLAYLALRQADRACLLVNGSVARSGTGAELLADQEVRRSYLGLRD